MSEKLHSRPESHGSQHPEAKKHQEVLKKHHEKEAATARHEHAKNLKDIRSKIETEAKTRHEHTDKHQEHHKDTEEQQPTFINKELKDVAYQRTLKKTQSRLSAPSRLFSKTIHQPAVEAASEIAGKTIARPSGILSGGIFAFLGGSFFLWMAKHYGFQYNFLLFVLLFVSGFFLGLLIELVVHLIKQRS